MSLLLPLLKPLTERQRQIFFVTLAAIGRHRPDGFQRLVDDDVAEATAALAQTLETSSRGVIYEQRATSAPAQRLLTELKALVAAVGGPGGAAFERDAASVMRAVERGALTLREVAGQSGDAFLALVERIARQVGDPAEPVPGEPATGPGSLIITP